MLFGQSTDPRISMTRPPQAMANFRPGLPRTGWYSHLHPFQQVMLPMAAAQAYYPQLPGSMGPNPAAAPAPLPAPAAAAAAASAPNPAAGPANGGFFGAAFGGGGMSPYRVMRTGMFPSARATAMGVRNPALQAGQIVRQATPSGYATANMPGGTIVTSG